MIVTVVKSVVCMCVTHVLFSSFAFLATLCMSHFGTETGHVVVALLCVPLLSTLFPAETKLAVLVFSLSVWTVRNTKVLVTN